MFSSPSLECTLNIVCIVFLTELGEVLQRRYWQLKLRCQFIMFFIQYFWRGFFFFFFPYGFYFFYPQGPLSNIYIFIYVNLLCYFSLSKHHFPFPYSNNNHLWSFCGQLSSQTHHALLSRKITSQIQCPLHTFWQVSALRDASRSHIRT